MNRSNKYISFTLIFSTAIVLTGCIVAPPNNNGSYQANNNNYGYNSNKVNLSLLHNIDESEADQRLSAKGFYQVRKNEPGNTKWLNSETSQCVEVLTNGGSRVSSVVERDMQFCNEHAGHNAGHNHHSGASEWDRGCADAKSGSYDRSGNAGQAYEEGWNSCKGSGNQNSVVIGQTPPALASTVGAKGGQAEGYLMNNGYVSVRSQGLVTYWQEQATGGCVAIRTADGRYQSIVYVAENLCR
jgi:general stress protein YciG